MFFGKKKQKEQDDPIIRRQNVQETPLQIDENLNHYILIILDSCRFDTFKLANPKNMQRLGTLEQRWSYASWTAPSHYNLLMGLFPHSSPQKVYASEYYKKEFIRFNERLGTTNFEFHKLVPNLYLPKYLQQLGYETHARVSMPVLNPNTPINVGFDSYRLMEKHNDMAAMIDDIDFNSERPQFVLFNVGETHYPYALPDESTDQWPRIHGVHGVFKHLDDHVVGGKLQEEKGPEFFNQKTLDELKDRQVKAVKYLDVVIEKLYDKVLSDTYITITSDHGELFGEDNYFGHGPIMHELVLNVPFIEGRISA